MLPYCLLSWAGQRAPVYLLYRTCRSLNSHVVPALASSVLVSFGALSQEAKSRTAPQIHGAGRQTGTIKPVRTPGPTLKAAWAEWKCAGARISISISPRSLLRGFPSSLKQRETESQRTEVQCRASAGGRSLTHPHFPVSSLCRKPPRRATLEDSESCCHCTAC